MTADAIPIENIYYLLCYAWDRLEEAELTDVSFTPEMTLPDLFARVLRSGVSHLLKRGIDRSYLTTEGEIAGIRGRLDVAASVKRSTFQRGRAWCAYDELSPNVLHNRIVKTTLRCLASVGGLDRGVAQDLRDLYRRMADVSELAITGQSFRRVALGRNTAFYGFLLDVCEIVYNNLLVDEKGGRAVFRDFTRDDGQMASLFERFLVRFYEREQHLYAVSAPHLRWRVSGSPEDVAYVPIMRTDLVLRGGDRAIVLDAKYYASTLTENFGKASIHSGHLYQLFAYLNHLAPEYPRESVGGVLLYPRTTQAFRADFMLFEHPVRVATVNLAQPWPGIRHDLLGLLSPLTSQVASEAS